VQAAPAVGGLVADLIALIETLGALAGTSLFVEVAQDAGEARRKAMLFVDGNSLLDSLVANRVSMGKVFCNNAGAGLVFLLEVVLVLVFGFSGGSAMLSCNLVKGLRGLNGDYRGAKLGLVEEKGGFSSPVAC
jgi:hypothetical protein